MGVNTCAMFVFVKYMDFISHFNFMSYFWVDSWHAFPIKPISILGCHTTNVEKFKGLDTYARFCRIALLNAALLNIELVKPKLLSL